MDDPPPYYFTAEKAFNLGDYDQQTKVNERIMRFENLSIQEFLSLGYVYLVMLGIFSDVIYYSYFEINILNYSTILDVLISPISAVIHDLKVIGAFVAFITLFFFLFTKGMPWMHYKYRDKPWYQKINDVEKLDKQFGQDKNPIGGIVLISVLVFSMYVGFGLGRGSKRSEQMEAGALKVRHELTFTNKEVMKVRIIGQNSSYVFYVIEDEKEVTISPINSNIKQIKLIQ